MADNKRLIEAKTAKQDEFYTRIEDIENEVAHYREHFKDAKVLCNCDDPRVSAFVRFFVMQFEILGLKRVTATCWKNTNPDLFSQGLEDRAVRLDWDGTQQPYHNTEDFKRIKCDKMTGDGDFRSDEVKALLLDSDIVVTNPPFSLFREYVTQLVESGKKFLIIGNQNALTYKEVFPLIMQNKLWLGYGFNGGNAYFRIPKENSAQYSANIYDKTTGLVHFRNTRWFTNMDIKKLHDHFESGSSYGDGASYRHYDNYDAIDVPRVSDIPMDYDGIMGVPITFLDVLNPDQFEIIGMTKSPLGNNLRTKVYGKQTQHSIKNGCDTKSEVTKLNDGAALLSKGIPDKSTYYEVDGKLYTSVYPRILVRFRR